MPEGRNIFPRLTVLENLQMGAYILKDNAEIDRGIEYAFTLFPRLRERSAQKGGTLSGGEQQMLATARGLMSNPRILLMDEPSMGLAPVLVDQIFDVIKEMNSRGTTILLVEQDALMALGIAHRAYVLQTGHDRAVGKGVRRGPRRERQEGVPGNLRGPVYRGAAATERDPGTGSTCRCCMSENSLFISVLTTS